MRSRSTILAAAAFAALVGALPLQASAQTVQRAYASNPGGPDSFNSNELVESGHQFFGSASRGLALALQEAIRRWGEPNGYILGQEASGAFFGGLRRQRAWVFWRRGQALHPQCRRPPHLLAGTIAGLRCRRRRRPHHDAGLQHALYGRSL